MKFQIKYLFALAALVFTSCSDSFLDLNPESNANAGAFYKTQSDFDRAVNAAYNTLYTIYAPEGAVSYTGELMGDNVTIYNISGNMADKWQFRDYMLAPLNTMNYTFWQNVYQSLFNLNIVIEQLEASSLDAAYKQRITGEMKFLRGLYYFNMVRIWGEIPIVTKPVTAAESYSYLRKPVAEVYQQITDDLTEAKESLQPASQVQAGRASKGSAQTLLGKVYLTLGDKTKAAEELLEVYNSSQYALLESYEALWRPDNKNTKESVFEIQFLGGAATNPYSDYHLIFFPNTNVLGFYGGGMNQVSDDIWNEFETGDRRRTASIDTGVVDSQGNFTAQKFPKKWLDKDAPLVGQRIMAGNNFMVLRYADVLLLLSEATGDPQYLNEVRERAGMPLYGENGYPARYNTVDLAVEHERRVELAFEFHRWFDLKRTGRALDVLAAKGKPVTTQKMLLPIPAIVRDQNPSITQNDGY